MHDCAARALETLERARNELRARLGQHLDGNIARNQALLDKLSYEVELGLRGGGKADLDFLEADAHEMLKHSQLARRVHGLDQSLVAVSQVNAAPDRRGSDCAVGPGAVGDVYGGEGSILGCRCP